jgi:SAM-dependent methyltransferase
LTTGLVPLTFVPSTCPLAAVHGRSNLREIVEAYGTGPYQDRLFEILECSQCGLGLSSPVPPPEDAAALYADRTSNDFQPDDPGLVARVKALFARRDAARFAKYSGQARKILDYACGNGAFSLALSQLFPAAQVSASDYHDHAPEGLASGGPNIQYLPYAKLTEAAGRFDLVVARHVLEHTYTPIEFLRSLRELAAPSGVVALEVPSLDTPLRRIFGRHWDNYYMPYHPLHFTKGSLTLAVEAAGFKVLGIGAAEMPKMGRSLRNVVGGSYTPLLFAAGVALQPVQVMLGWLTGSSVCMRLWARRD